LEGVSLAEKRVQMIYEGVLALFYLCSPELEEPQIPYNINWEEQETADLLAFVQLATKELSLRGLQPTLKPETVRITSSLRIFIGNKELKVRPMAKTVLLLFLKHPEGIPLKHISDYQEELTSYYRRVSKSSTREEIDRRVVKMMDLFNNELNVNIARINRAVANLVDEASSYLITGDAGYPKSIPLNRKWVIWE
jgi:hypothetical protein